MAGHPSSRPGCRVGPDAVGNRLRTAPAARPRRPRPSARRRPAGGPGPGHVSPRWRRPPCPTAGKGAADDYVPEGEYQVTVTGFRAVRAGKGAADDYVTQNALPDRYARVETSGLRARVAPGANDLEPFRLQPK